MSIAVTDEHRELEQVVRAFLVRNDVLKGARACLDGDGADVPVFWAEIAALGWLGLHVPEEVGGSGFGLEELAVVAEQLGRACTPGPFVPTVVVAAALAFAPDGHPTRALLPALVAGEATAALGVAGAVRLVDGTVQGAAFVLGSGGADVLALLAGDDLVVVRPDAPGLHLVARQGIDPSMPVAEVTCSAVAAGEGDVVSGAAASARRVLQLVVAAQAAGGAAACREMAVAYAKERVAFGRFIGGFQAVKHRCADLLIDEQLAVASAWDAAHSARGSDIEAATTAAAAAAAVALPAFVRCAAANIQLHGGIGFTWEHDAHLFLRRAAALDATGDSNAAAIGVAAAGLDAGGAPDVDLPPEAEEHRAAVRRFLAEYRSAPEEERHRLVVDAGYLFPHWPPPWGRGADAVEQVVIDEELRDVPRMAPLGPTGWTLPINIPTIIAHGTDDQRERWIRPTMEGRLTWCQLLSEPGAGSDLAALSTRAERADGGWLVTGQKVWTSNAHDASLGFAMVRTDRAAGKHEGITCMVVDMTSPGVTVRPLRQITGEAEFNEVFLDEVFVPDDDVVGAVGGGWKVARTSLGNERVSLGEASWTSPRAHRVIDERAWAAASTDSAVAARHGELVATGRAVRALSLRAAARALTGSDPGVEGGLTKLVRAEHNQRVADFGRRLLGPEALFADGASTDVARSFLQSRAATIAGGTSEIVRNIIAERILGLPRERAE